MPSSVQLRIDLHVQKSPYALQEFFPRLTLIWSAMGLFRPLKVDRPALPNSVLQAIHSVVFTWSASNSSAYLPRHKRLVLVALPIRQQSDGHLRHSIMSMALVPHESLRMMAKIVTCQSWLLSISRPEVTLFRWQDVRIKELTRPMESMSNCLLSFPPSSWTMRPYKRHCLREYFSHLTYLFAAN